MTFLILCLIVAIYISTSMFCYMVVYPILYALYDGLVKIKTRSLNNSEITEALLFPIYIPFIMFAIMIVLLGKLNVKNFRERIYYFFNPSLKKENEFFKKMDEERSRDRDW